MKRTVSILTAALFVGALSAMPAFAQSPEASPEASPAAAAPESSPAPTKHHHVRKHHHKKASSSSAATEASPEAPAPAAS